MVNFSNVLFFIVGRFEKSSNGFQIRVLVRTVREKMVVRENVRSTHHYIQFYKNPSLRRNNLIKTNARYTNKNKKNRANVRPDFLDNACVLLII